jgi:hypothetical protein
MSAIAVCLLAPGCAKSQKPETEQVTAAVAEAKPKIAVADKEFDFGQVREGATVEHVFQIVNEGDGELLIEQARSSCGCLATVLGASRIPPGGKGEIKTSLKTAGRPGRVNQKIHVISNDPINRSQSLTIEGEVIADIAVTPSTLWLGEVKRGDKAIADFFVVVNEPDRVKITSVTVEDKRFKVRRKSESTDRNIQYELQFSAGSKIETVSAQVLVNSEGSGVPAVRLPVRAEVIGDLRYPKMIQFFNTGGHFAPVQLVVSSRSNKRFKIKKAEDPDKVLKLTIVEANGPNAQIRAEVADQKSIHGPSSPRSRAVVYTDDKNEPKLEILYLIYKGPAPGQNVRRPPSATPNVPGK